MPAAAVLTPRVRIMVICSDVIPSDTEADVFTLEEVRQYLVARSLPCLFRAKLYLVMSNPRKGTYYGNVRLVHERIERVIRYVKFHAAFEQNGARLALVVDLGMCQFPEVGDYTFQVFFSSQGGDEVLKAEQTFEITAEEE